MRVTVVHLDLGIGGAERLVVNTCCALQELGHDIDIITSHHDPSHCFEETKPGGRLAKHIHVYGDWMPRNILGKCTAFFSIVRMLYLAFVILLRNIFTRNKSDLVFIDGVSAPIPLFKFMGLVVFFYCHFPDKLLVTDYGGPVKRSYRYIMDAIEENSTGCADLIAVNSTFTSEEFRRAFTFVGSQVLPSILNPTVENDIMVDDYLQRKHTSKSSECIAYTQGSDAVFVSINRFERIKRLELAIGALKLLYERIAGNYKNHPKKITLVVAGGYDPQVRENIEYLAELKKLVGTLGLTNDVVFRTSIGQEERFALLSVASALIYTPGREHFGIVPCEAMALGTPVIAVASGGPLETINEGATGFLCPQNPRAFADNMMRFVIDTNLSVNMAEKCRKHVEANFTGEILRSKLQLALKNCQENKNCPRVRFYVRKTAYAVTR